MYEAWFKSLQGFAMHAWESTVTLHCLKKNLQSFLAIVLSSQGVVQFYMGTSLDVEIVFSLHLPIHI